MLDETTRQILEGRRRQLETIQRSVGGELEKKQREVRMLKADYKNISGRLAEIADLLAPPAEQVIPRPELGADNGQVRREIAEVA